MERDDEVLVVDPGRGRPVTRLNGEQTVIKAGRIDTAGAYALRENLIPAGFRRVPMHRHRDADEAFYVLDGVLSVRAGERRIDAEPGAFVLIARGTAHALANLGDRPARWLTVFSPAERAEWVEAEDDLLAASQGSPDPDALAAIHRRYGLELLGPPPSW
jgi:mannose-6-phosphate isomerase-like protein (cupin superfamily)